ncbi:facilitated trehalose transporter Tret1-like isoform X2 [Rhodnius prolixus]|uniref:facilitated trehalose transporter Tret1-like isoform X2 n=1 Tax=Rhodnius prolixus TaxID=13249 RepID=UPI003D18D677
MEATKLMPATLTDPLNRKLEGESSVKYKCRSDPEQHLLTEVRRNPTWLEVSPQILASAISLSIFIQVGVHMGYSGVLIPQLADDPNIEEFTKHQASWIASLVIISQPIGALLAGPLMDYLGRKKAGIITNIPMLVSWMMIYFTEYSLWPIYIARILAGLSSGMAAVGMIYTSEISHAQFRSMLLTLESPHWLANFTDASNTKIKAQMKYLYSAEWLIEEEWTRIQDDISVRKKGLNQEESASNPLRFIKGFLERTSYIPMSILGVLFFLQQTSGTYVVIFYTVNIFKSIGGDFGMGFNEYNATTTLGILRFIMSFITLVLSKKLGRRILLIISSAIMALSALATALFLKLNHISTVLFEATNSTSQHLKQSEEATIIGENVAPAEIAVGSWWILISMLTFLCGSALGQMVIPWAMIGELLPTKIRASGNGLVRAFTAIILFIMIKTFPFLTDRITLPMVFGSYSLMSVLTIIFTYFYLPETFGKTLAEIAKYFVKG